MTKTTPQKRTKFSDIPRFVAEGQWECDYRPDRLIAQVDCWIEEDGLDMNPDFQRGHVWTQQQQEAYIEFFMRGGKTGRVFYFNNPTWNRAGPENGYKDFVIVDGLQRLTAWRRFFSNEIRLCGSLLKEFNEEMRMSTNTVKVNVNDLRTRADVLQWYVDFNCGGTVHSDEEIARVRGLIAAELGSDRKP
jgi:hypothetical protein